MTESAAVEESQSGEGAQLQAVATVDKTIIQWDDPAITRFAHISFLQTFTGDIPDALDFKYTRDIDVRTASITKGGEVGSSLEGVLVDNTKTKFSQYDDLYGFKLGQTIAKRYFFSVIKLQPADTYPIAGNTYTPERSVLWSGFNDIGASLNLKTEEVGIQLQGMENILNDVQVIGVVEFDMQTGVGARANLFKSDASFVTHTDGHKCIFNEGGRPDQLDTDNLSLKNKKKGGTEGVDMRNPYFNKSGFGPTKLWSILEILKYLHGWYIVDPKFRIERSAKPLRKRPRER